MFAFIFDLAYSLYFGFSRRFHFISVAATGYPLFSAFFSFCEFCLFRSCIRTPDSWPKKTLQWLARVEVYCTLTNCVSHASLFLSGLNSLSDPLYDFQINFTAKREPHSHRVTLAAKVKIYIRCWLRNVTNKRVKIYRRILDTSQKREWVWNLSTNFSTLLNRLEDTHVRPHKYK